LGVTFACWISCSRMRLVEDPGEENATVLPAGRVQFIASWARQRRRAA
jgi:hypothetical protein